MAGKLEGKVALVTGASSGIGRAAAIAFAKEGAKVVLASRREDKLIAVAEEIKAAGGEAAVVVSDVTKEADCKKMVDTAVETFGGLHVAFNNHGVGKMYTFADISEEDTADMLDTNLKSLVFCFKYQIPAMGTSGDKGSIIVTTSAAATRPLASPGVHLGVYAATKAGADMLMKYGAIEGAASGVRVNSVAPGMTNTPMLDYLPSEAMPGMLKSLHLIDRIVQPEEVAKVAIFLASDDASMVTGSVYPVDCGWSIKA